MKINSKPAIDVNHNIEKLIVFLGLDKNKAMFVEYTKEDSFDADFDNCHINNLIKAKFSGGDLVFGWTIWED